MSRDLKWSDDLLLGIELIDEQHHEIFRRFERFLGAVADGQDKKAAIQLMGFIQIYIKRHFNDEEEFLKNISYPGFEGHRKLHVFFIEKFNSMQMRFLKEGSSDKFMEEFNSNVILWLVKHIRSADGAVREFISQNNQVDCVEF